MFERNIYDQYGLYCDEKFQIGSYEGFRSRNDYYVLMPCPRKQDNIWVQLDWSERLKSTGIQQFAELVSGIDGKAISRVDGVQQLLFQMPGAEERTAMSDGKTLALIHESSRGWVPNRTDLHLQGRWLSLWETRIDQLESFHATVDRRPEKTAFDEKFLYTFPYYLGRAETAMQWLVEEGQEHLLGSYDGSVNHIRFTPGTWLVADQHCTQVKNPLAFVYDHPSRDLGECLRYCYEKDDPSSAAEFLEDYSGGQPLQEQTWALIGARLLFPITYVELMEAHYLNERTKEADINEGVLQFEAELDREERYMNYASQCLLDAFPVTANGHWFAKRIFTG
ncbi:spore coat protein YutH [Geomicrobium halophilum]|uniref:Spore coat protein YutH n=1 Tax=Geomicrobium halophilum TaxID=549000 RepID=A0A841PZW7_9BACL|nr:spore coat protein YutH [Geomicrobium halophilum]MBB6450205.1 spore coat protein YutH [Geomicrobium halophilum]